MKFIITLLLLGFLFSPVLGQNIRYEKSFAEALTKAATQKKLVFLVIDAPLPPGRTFSSGMDMPEAVTKYNKNFINYQVSTNDTASTSLKKKYPVTVFPAYFFVDSHGNIVYRSNRNSSSVQRYIMMADSAIKQKATGKNLTDYQLLYNLGKMDANLFKEYIALREKLDIDDNSKLIEEYVTYLPIKSLDNYQDVLFILKAGPIVYGKAYTLAHINRKIIDSIYKKEPLANRLAINGRMINNTFNAAVATKNVALAQQLSSFIQATYNPDYGAGMQWSLRNMVAYYQTIKDTANYLRQASYYFDNYYMTISADSAKKLIQEEHIAYLKKLTRGAKVIPLDTSKRLKIDTSRKRNLVGETLSTNISSFQDVATALNNAAYAFYYTGTHNPNYLLKAITWSRRSIELKPSASFYDTLAHLLYRYGFYAEAEANENLAIATFTQPNQGKYMDYLKAELVKIKRHTL